MHSAGRSSKAVKLKDVYHMQTLLESLGCTTVRDKETLRVHAAEADAQHALCGMPAASCNIRAAGCQKCAKCFNLRFSCRPADYRGTFTRFAACRRKRCGACVRPLCFWERCLAGWGRFGWNIPAAASHRKELIYHIICIVREEVLRL